MLFAQQEDVARRIAEIGHSISNWRLQCTRLILPDLIVVAHRIRVEYRKPKADGHNNTAKTPLYIHRVSLGTHKPIGFLIKHYAGNFPLWLAPDQCASSRSTTTKR